MNLIRWIQVTNIREAVHQLTNVGADPTGIKLMKDKTLHFNFKIEGLNPKIANILKQEMLSIGGDVALDRRSLDCSTDLTDVILMGNKKQFEKLIIKIEQYPNLKELSLLLKETINNISKTHFIIKCRRHTLRLGERTLLMGILNVTPDSFSDGGFYLDKDKAIAKGIKMVEEGADIIDIGGESTRPGAKPLPIEEELRRVIPVIEKLAREIEVPISIDTYKSTVAKEAIEAGAEIVNDISGLHFDPELPKVISEEKTPVILMHIRGTPETMQKDVHYQSLFSEIINYLKESIRIAVEAGVDSEKIIIDPGIGFGKRVEDNLLIIKYLSEFRVLGKPILLGTSRKSFIGTLLNVDVNQRLEGSLASMAIGALNGAHIIRCHDVAQTKKALTIVDAIKSATYSDLKSFVN